MASEYLFIATRRGGKWVAKRVDNVTAEDLAGLNFTRDFMSALSPSDDADAAIIQVETNLRAGEDPFEALRAVTQSTPGVELVRKLVREAGYRVTLLGS